MEEERDVMDQPFSRRIPVDPPDGHRVDNDADEDDGDSSSSDESSVIGYTPDDPGRMDITEDERQWAITIKEAVEADPELENMNDFWYAQFAIICPGSIESVLCRIESLQGFLKNYRIRDSEEEGCRVMQRAFQMCPETFLHFGFNPEDGVYHIVNDMAKHKPTQSIQHPQDEETWFAASYYLCNAVNPDMEAIRDGCNSVNECHGVGMTSKKEMMVIVRLFQELYSCYPLKGRVRSYHTGVVYNTIHSMMKRAVPEEQRSNFQIGLDTDVRLNEIYLVPSVEVATARVLKEIGKALRRRYDNERSFTLAVDEQMEVNQP